MLPSLSPRRSVEPLTGVIGAFESETQTVIRQTTPYSQHAILHAVAAMIVLTVILMCVVRLDRVVTSEGSILPAGGSLFVQPLDRAIVSAILVHPGDVVKKGQALADLDPTFATADATELQQKLESDRALVARLEAEQAGRPYVASNPSDPNQQLQASIWRQRQAEYHQSLADYDQRISSDQSIMTKAHQDLLNDQQHLALTAQMAQMQQDLSKKGWGSQALVISANDTRVQAARQLDESRNNEAQSGHDLASLQAQRAAYIGKWRDDVGTQLVAARNDLDQAQQTFAKARKVHDLDKLVAPADAVVLSVANASVGSVVNPQTAPQPLFTLTPLSGPLEAEVRVAAPDIGYIRPGDHVSLKLDAFSYTSHGTARGVVKSISDGAFSQADDGHTVPTYFKVRVAITDSHLRNVPADFRLIPGMTLKGDVLIGGRTIMAYLLEGALRTGSEAMREP
jgi:HlyD family type I secretion membrane fusion protein